LAAALIDGEVGVKQFTDESVNRPEIRELINRVKYVLPEDLADREEEAFAPQEIVVRLKDGKEYSREVCFSDVPGSPKNPLTWEEQVAKFKDCTQMILSARRVNEIVEVVAQFEDLSSVNELTKLLVFSDG
jgi:2-methylcitrate dehydratase PrpD